MPPAHRVSRRHRQKAATAQKLRTTSQTRYRGRVHDVTYHGIHKWHNHLYEHLGWMVLAKHHGYTDKINSYKHSVLRLKTAIEQKLAGIHDLDRKDDLMILHRNVLVLMEHVNKDFH
jgi:hypothetical protein